MTMFMLPPALQSVRRRYLRCQRQNLSQAIADQRRFRGIMNVGFDDEGIATHRRDRFGLQGMPRLHDRVADLLHRLGPQLEQVIFDPPPVKIYFLLPITDAMICRKLRWFSAKSCSLS